MPQNSCLCKVCENTSLMEKGLRQSCKPKDILMDPQLLHYLYDLDLNDYMMSLYSECKHDGLSVDDLIKMIIMKTMAMNVKMKEVKVLILILKIGTR